MRLYLFGYVNYDVKFILVYENYDVIFILLSCRCSEY